MGLVVFTSSPAFVRYYRLISARRRRNNSSDASISTLRIDTLSTFTPSGSPLSRAYSHASA